MHCLIGVLCTCVSGWLPDIVLFKEKRGEDHGEKGESDGTTKSIMWEEIKKES